jgi:hypothetical protein
LADRAQLGRRSLGGVLRTFVRRLQAAGSRAAKGCPGVPGRATAAVAALRRLPCDARSHGPVGQLAALTSFVPLRHSLPSQRTKRAVRAVRTPCASRRCTGAPRHTRTALCSNGGGARCNEDLKRWFAAGGMRWGRLLVRREAQRVGRRAAGALRDLTCRMLFERSARRARSELCGTPGTRASQGSRRSRPIQHEPLSHAACRDAPKVECGPSALRRQPTSAPCPLLHPSASC